MKKVYAFLGLFILTLNLTAQNKETKKADKYFEELEYNKAIDAYVGLIDAGKGGKYTYTQLGHCYYNMSNSELAMKWYNKVINAEEKNPEVLFRYAELLRFQGKYEDAFKKMEEFSKLVPTDQRSIDFQKKMTYLPSLSEARNAFELKSASDLNSEVSDYGAVLNDSTVYFASSRNTRGVIYGWFVKPYLDVFQAKYTDSSFVNVKMVDNVNIKYNNGPATVTTSGETMYFSGETVNSQALSSGDVGYVKLFRAVNKGKGWESVKELPFNSSKYDISNPSISLDDKTLYFSSNMPGGQGGFDIWKIEVKGDGKYGQPENLGSNVNSSANETFPFVDDAEVLYFSSDREGGLGGKDVYVYDQDQDESPVNLGSPTNSSKDDFAFSINREKNLGFVSSNREGDNNIYIAKPVCGVVVKVIAKNIDNGALLPETEISLFDMSKRILGKELTDKNGVATFYVECDKRYGIEAAKVMFENGSFTVKGADGGEKQIEAKIKPLKAKITDKEIILKDIVFPYNSSRITKDAKVILNDLVKIMTDFEEMKIEVGAHTDGRGSEKYNLRLSDKRAKSVVKYIVSEGISSDRISGIGYGETQPKIDCKFLCTNKQHEANRRSEFKIVKEEK